MSVKWWQKVMFWLLQVSIVKSYIIYTTTLRQLGQQPQSHLEFCREFILQFVAHRLQLPPPSRFGPHVDLSLERLRPVTHFSEESERRWDCRVCSVVGRHIPHHTFVLPALIGHIYTPDIVSGQTTRGRTFSNKNQT